MTQFGMLQEHKDVLRENQVFLVHEMNPEPLIIRLKQLGVFSQSTVENIQVLPTRRGKNGEIISALKRSGPSAFKQFCRALSSTNQCHIRIKIQPEGVKWSVDLRTVITYDGETLNLHKSRRSMTVTVNEWNNLMRHIPQIQANLDLKSDIKLQLQDDLYVVTGNFQDHMYVGFHRLVGEEMLQGSGFNVNMEEWTEFLTVMDTITEEINESHPKTYELDIYKLINFCHMYILKRDIQGRANNNCYGCQNDSPGQRDHMEAGCLSDYSERVQRYYPEAIVNLSRPLFAEVCRYVLIKKIRVPCSTE